MTDSKFVDHDILNELKHSIRMHLAIMAGPTQQLSMYLIKLVDFFEDPDRNRRNNEMLALSYNIIEGVALYVQRSIDERAEKAKLAQQEFPHRIRLASDNILIIVGKTRNLNLLDLDRIAAKNAVLRAIADALRELHTFTKATYPNIIDSSGAVL